MPSPTLKLKYNAESKKFQSVLGIWLDDVKVKLFVTDKTIKEVQSGVTDTEIGLEKPGHFLLEHHLQKNHTRFQFHSGGKILDKDVKLTFVHHKGPNVTTLEATSQLDKHNKVSVKQNLAKSAPLVKYEFKNDGLAIEPQFDFGASTNAAWSVSVKQAESRKDYVKVAYSHHRKEAELEVSRDIKGGVFKATATVEVNHLKKTPRFVVEKEWKL